MTVSDLVKAGNFNVLNSADTDRAVTGVYIGDLLSWVMGRAKAGDIWITIMSNINVVAVASLADVSCVILAEGAELDGDAMSAAKEKEINIIKSEFPIYETAVMISELLK